MNEEKDTSDHNVIIESPYSAKDETGIQENIDYAIKCMQDSIGRGEAPFVPHLMYTLPNAKELNGNSDKKHWLTREKGFALTNNWRNYGAYKTVFYVDRGWSTGMKEAKNYCDDNNLHYEERRLAPKKILYQIKGNNAELKKNIARLLFNAAGLSTLMTHDPSFPVEKFDSCNMVIQVFPENDIVEERKEIDGRIVYVITTQ
jgi:hypothetical protein